MRTFKKVTRYEGRKSYTEIFDENYVCLPDSETYRCEEIKVTEEEIDRIKEEMEKDLDSMREIYDKAFYDSLLTGTLIAPVSKLKNKEK